MTKHLIEKFQISEPNSTLSNTTNISNTNNDQIEKTAEGDLVLNGFITVFKEKLGSGAFCTVKKAIGTYKADGEDIPEDIVVPYAVKIYEKSHLKGISHRQRTGLNFMSNLEAA